MIGWMDLLKEGGLVRARVLGNLLPKVAQEEREGEAWL